MLTSRVPHARGSSFGALDVWLGRMRLFPLVFEVGNVLLGLPEFVLETRDLLYGLVVQNDRLSYGFQSEVDTFDNLLGAVKLH